MDDLKFWEPLAPETSLRETLSAVRLIIDTVVNFIKKLIGYVQNGYSDPVEGE